MDLRENNHNNTGNGFLLGVIVGGIATLLFTTKKGREIVKDLTEKGLDKFSEIQQNLNEAVEIEEIEGEDYINRDERPVGATEEKKPKLLAEETKPKASDRESLGEGKPSGKSHIRRFFKSSKKN